MKTYTLSQIKDEMIGKVGTPQRNKYESKLNLNLENREEIIKAAAKK